MSWRDYSSKNMLDQACSRQGQSLIALSKPKRPWDNRATNNIIEHFFVKQWLQRCEIEDYASAM
jgi:hypothetical protein